MEILLDQEGSIKSLEDHIAVLESAGVKDIMAFQAEGGIGRKGSMKKEFDALLGSALDRGTRVFGGIFPGIFDGDRLMKKGCILAGIKTGVHIAVLDELHDDRLFNDLEKKIRPIESQLKKGQYKTLFVFGDGFGELNLNLINGLNRLGQACPSLKVIGGLTGRESVKASLYSIFSPGRIIQNGAVLAFTKLESGIGVRHGWTPLPQSTCQITRVNGCFVEQINHIPALDFYLDFISQKDPAITQNKKRIFQDPDLFFEKIAIEYPLGIIRSVKGRPQFIDRTAVSVGGDKSLQFSVEIPEGTKVCILHIAGRTVQDRCRNIKEAVKAAYMESLENFPTRILDRRVIIMDCFGRQKVVEKMGQDYGQIEFGMVAKDQKGIRHSPMGPLTLGEISGVEGSPVALHNKTIVIATMEDN